MEELRKIIEELYGYVTDLKGAYEDNSKNTLKVLTYILNKIEEQEKKNKDYDDNILALNSEISSLKENLLGLNIKVSKLENQNNKLIKENNVLKKEHKEVIKENKQSIKEKKEKIKNALKETKLYKFLYKIINWRKIKKAEKEAAEAARLAEIKKKEEEQRLAEELKRKQEEEMLKAKEAMKNILTPRKNK